MICDIHNDEEKARYKRIVRKKKYKESELFVGKMK
jgi:hypothetical protein